MPGGSKDKVDKVIQVFSQELSGTPNHWYFYLKSTAGTKNGRRTAVRIGGNSPEDSLDTVPQTLEGGGRHFQEVSGDPNT